jgi:hypothetical protein
MKFQAWVSTGTCIGSVMDKNKVRKKDMKSSSRKLTDHGNKKKLCHELTGFCLIISSIIEAKK